MESSTHYTGFAAVQRVHYINACWISMLRRFSVGLWDCNNYCKTITHQFENAALICQGFYDVGHLPANDNVRYTISEPARIEILKRLSALNRQRWEEEEAAGLHKKGKK